MVYKGKDTQNSGEKQQSLKLCISIGFPVFSEHPFNFSNNFVQ